MSTSKIKEQRIQLAKFVSQNLLFRNSADELFEYINKIEPNNIIIDFNKVQSITRAFTHQYLLNKKKSKKKITDINISPHVQNMFEIITSS